MNYKIWFRDTVTLNKGKTINTFGKATFQETKNIKVKKEDKVKMIKNLQGKEIVSTATVFAFPEDGISIGDYIGNLEVKHLSLKKDHKGRPAYVEVYL